MKFVVLALLLVSGIGSAQQPLTGAASSKGNCSPSVTGNKNVITVTCTDELSRRTILALLQAIHDSKLPAEQILARLAEMQEQLKASLPVRLSNEQRHELTDILRPLAGTSIDIFCNPDLDSCALADDFASVFNEAGWLKFSSPQMINMPHDPSRPLHPEIRAIRKADVTDFKGVQIRWIRTSLQQQQERGSHSLEQLSATLAKYGLLSEKPIVVDLASPLFPPLELFVGQQR